MTLLSVGTTDDDGTGDGLVEAGHFLNALLGGGVVSRTDDVGAATATRGFVYIVPASATGAWVGQDNKFALYSGSAWVFYTPDEGCEVWVKDADERVRYSGSSWSAISYGGTGGGATLVAGVVKATEIGIYDLSVNTLDSGNEIDIDVTGYDWVEIRVNRATTATSTELIVVQTSTNGGSTWDTTLTNYPRHRSNAAGDTWAEVAAEQGLVISSGGTTQSSVSKIENLNNSDFEVACYSAQYGSDPLTGHYYTEKLSKETVNALRILSDNGNAFTGGEIKVVGYSLVSTTGEASDEVMTSTVLGTYDLSVNTLDSGNEILIDVTDYDELEVTVINGSVGTADLVAMRVGTSATVDAGASDYRRQEGATQADVNWMRVTGGTATAGISGFAEVRNLNTADQETSIATFAQNTTAGLTSIFWRKAKQVNTHVQFFSLNGNAFTGGTLRVVGKKRINVSGAIQKPAAITSSQNATEAMFAGNVYQEVDTTSGNVTITIPSGLVNEQPCTFENTGANSLIFATSGTTLNQKDSFTTIGSQYGVAVIVPKGSNVFVGFGDFSS